MYNTHEDFTLGQLVPIAIAFLIAYFVARAVAMLKLVSRGNMNKWAIFFATVTGIGYGIYMSASVQPKSDFLRLAGPIASALMGGFVSWLFFYFAFASVMKDEE